MRELGVNMANCSFKRGLTIFRPLRNLLVKNHLFHTVNDSALERRSISELAYESLLRALALGQFTLAATTGPADLFPLVASPTLYVIANYQGLASIAGEETVKV